MKTRHWIAVMTALLAMALLPGMALAWEGRAENRYFYWQLDADERAVYDALLSLSPPDKMSAVSCSVPMPEDTSRYSSMDFVMAAWYAFQYDHPGRAAWISTFWICGPEGEQVRSGELQVGTPDRLPDYDALVLEVHPACTWQELDAMNREILSLAGDAHAGMSRYERAAWAQRTVSGRLTGRSHGDAGALSSPLCIFDGYANCEGFSKVYKILADSLDLPCVLSGGEDHMYVQVQMEDGNWYLVEPQGGLLLVGRNQVSGIPAYVPQQGPVHFEAREGHGRVSLPPLPGGNYVRREAPRVTDRPAVRPPAGVDGALVPGEMPVPDLRGRRFGPDSMNIVVYWVQIQMKATGSYYTGEQWDETGNLGDHTREEIRRFMRDQGDPSHDGWVDQAVIDALAARLGSRLRPVYRGGYYRYMDALLEDSVWETSEGVYPNGRNGSGVNRRGIRWVQTALSMLGYYHGGVDGDFGSGTASAVRAFQRDHGFQEREYVSYGVARAMVEALWQRGCDLSRLP